MADQQRPRKMLQPSFFYQSGNHVVYEETGVGHMSNSHSSRLDHRSIVNIAGNRPIARGGRVRRTRPPICSCELCGDTFTTTFRLKSKCTYARRLFWPLTSIVGHHNRFHPEPGRQARFACLHCCVYDTTYPNDLKRHQDRCPSRPAPSA